MSANNINDREDSLKSTLSSIKIKELISSAAPENTLPDAGDEGDILTVVSGEWASAPAPDGVLPDVGDEGDVLTVVSGEWASAPATGDSPLPFLNEDVPITNNDDTTYGLQLYEASSNGSHSVRITAPDSLADDYTLTLPTTNGTSGQVLSTDGSGALSWIANGSASGVQSGLLSGTVSKTNTTFSDASASGHSLSFDTGANERWSFIIHAEIGGATGGFKWQFTLPGGAGTFGTASAWYGITNMGSGVSMATGGSAAAVPNPSLLTIHGEVFTENAGTVMLQFAQNSASGSSFISAGAVLHALKET